MNDDPSRGLRGRVATGTRLNGIYEIDRLIATGGMGEVYKGHAIQTGDAVAIKMIRPDLAENDAALALFRKEASALHNLYHEAIIRYYVFSIDPALGSPYLAMEFVEGPSLSDQLKGGPLAYEDVRLLQKRIAAGLAAAHDIGIIHRDVSPDNVILAGGSVRRAKIIDFGIARSTKMGEGTIIGSGFAGKYNYVSPEQLGLYGGDVGPKSDIYSLGLVLAEAVIGKPLDMGGSQVQVIEKRREVPDLSRVDGRFQPLLEAMLQPDPEERPASMAEVASWTEGFPDEEAPPQREKSKTKMRRPATALSGRRPVAAATPVRRRSWQLPAALGAVLLVAGGTAAGLYFGSDVLPSGPPSPIIEEEKIAPPPGPTPGPTPGPSPTPAPVPPPGNPRVEQLRSYVQRYDGGDCFFVTPIDLTESSARIEGYGIDPKAFKSFDEAFKSANGFEAQVELRPVTPQQCPVVDFLGLAVKERGAVPPRLSLGRFTVRNKEMLTGSVERQGQGPVEVLLVSDEGAVHNLSNFRKPPPDGPGFELQLETSGPRSSRPQIVIAVTSERPLAVLQPGARPLTADKLFPLLLGEASKTGQTIGVAVKYFKLEG